MAKKETENGLSRDQAKLVLENVFNACSVPPNSVPMEILEDNIKHNRFITLLTRAMAVAALAALVFLPLFFSKANVSCSLGIPQGDAVQVTVDVATLLPVGSVEITLDGEPLDWVKTGGLYSATVTENGTLVAKVTTVNNQTAQASAEIRAFADRKPTIVSHELQGGRFTFTVEQGSYPVDFPAIYALDEEGGAVAPASWDEASGQVVFEGVEGVYNFFVPDIKGNVLQAILTPTS